MLKCDKTSLGPGDNMSEKSSFRTSSKVGSHSLVDSGVGVAILALLFALKFRTNSAKLVFFGRALAEEHADETLEAS